VPPTVPRSIITTDAFRRRAAIAAANAAAPEPMTASSYRIAPLLAQSIHPACRILPVDIVSALADRCVINLREAWMSVVAERVRLLPTAAGGVDTVARFFRALGDPTRLRLLEFLLREEHTVTECVAYVGLAQSRVSTHLSCLADCGYVQARRMGRNAFYTVADPRVAELVRLAHALAADNCTALDGCQRIPPTTERVS
jgi:DNA-binding transcriptional ArsR family regulator